MFTTFTNPPAPYNYWLKCLDFLRRIQTFFTETTGNRSELKVHTEFTNIPRPSRPSRDQCAVYCKNEDSVTGAAQEILQSLVELVRG
jgi:hypothetical protein